MKIVVGGQLEKTAIAEKIQQVAGDKITSVEIMGDIEAAMAVSSGQADYYFGACNTGAGGAIAMAMAIVGADKCISVALPGQIMSDDEIKAQITAGKVAFGFTAQDIEQVVPSLISALLAHQ